MRTVTMKKVDLLAHLTRNRDTHITEFADTIAGWRVKYTEALQRELDKMNDAGYVPSRPFSFDFAPKSHESDYDIAISMVNDDVREEIELTQDEYREYVLDDWDWMTSFKMSNSTYSGIR